MKIFFIFLINFRFESMAFIIMNKLEKNHFYKVERGNFFKIQFLKIFSQSFYYLLFLSVNRKKGFFKLLERY